MSSRGCPSEDELVRMVEGALRNESLMVVESHVDTCEHCAAVIASFAALGASTAKPRVVGRYQLDRRIGGGGMGEVWAAWDPQLRRDIAVKLVKPERADDATDRERLKREARALARLTHPNVLAVYDVGETGDEVFIATELVIGDTLASRGGANSDWRALVKLYAQAARGLAAAHGAGLVHRDIKPANLLLGTDGRVRVADFGLAVKSPTPSPLAATELAGRELYTTALRLTQTGYIAGTPAYMAPEQRLGEPPDARADQYALCIALVESVAGRLPPLDLGHEAMIAFVGERRPREPELDRLCGVMARGLSIDRDERYADMDKLADALEGCVATTAVSSDLVRPIVLPARRTMWFAIAGGAALVGVASVLVAWKLSGRDDTAIAANVPAPPPIAIDAAPAVVTPIDTTDVVAQPNVAPIPIAPVTPGSAATVPRAKPTTPTTPTTPTSMSPETQQQLDLGLAAARRAIGKHDGMTCIAAINALPTNLPIMSAYMVDFHRGQCEMLRGECDKGIKLVNSGLDGLGSPQNGDALSVTLCPITGPYDVRFKRLTNQGHNATTPALCKTYVKSAKQLAAEVKAPNEKAILAGVLRHLAKCVGDCGESQSLWNAAAAIDPIDPKWDIDGCDEPEPPASAAPTTMSVQAVSELLAHTQDGITRRDTRVCKELLDTRGIPSSMQPSYDLIAGFCKMMVGDCKGGGDLVAKVPNQPVASNQEIYCPIAGSLDTRLARMRMQLLTFADKRFTTVRPEWCSYMIGAAKTAAREVQTDDQRERVTKVLQHISWCMSMASRCGEAKELWSLSATTGGDPTPQLSAKCP